MPCEKILLFLALNMEEGDHEPRNSGGLWKLEDAGKWILPQRLQKGSTNTSVLTQ